MKIEVTEVQKIGTATEDITPVAHLYRQIDADGNPTGALSLLWVVKFQPAVPHNQDTILNSGVL